MYANKNGRFVLMLFLLIVMLMITVGCSNAGMDVTSEDDSISTENLNGTPADDTEEGIADSQSNNTEEASEDWETEDPYATDSDVKTADDAIFYFLEGNLAGSYEYGKWYSLNSDGSDLVVSKVYYVQDILSEEEYQIYHHGQYLGSSSTAYMHPGVSGIGEFETTQDVRDELEKYGTDINSNGLFAYRLPLLLSSKLQELRIPNYSFNVYFRKEEDYENLPTLVTNNAAELYPRPMKKVEEIPEATKKTLLNLFAENNMENAIPHFTNCVKGDFDNDGNNEMLTVANSPYDDTGYPYMEGWKKGSPGFGYFCVLIFEDNDNDIDIVYSDLRPFPVGSKNDDTYSCQLLDIIEVADLNNDGSYEIAVNKLEWEDGFYMVFSLENRHYQKVMLSMWGM